MQEICVSSGSYILIDTETVQWWLEEVGIDASPDEVDEVIGRIHRMVITEAREHSLSVYHTLFGKE